MDLTELILDIAKQGPLVGLLLYLMIRNQGQLDLKDKSIQDLHAENKLFLKEELSKTRETINNNTVAFNAFKDVLKTGGNKE